MITQESVIDGFRIFLGSPFQHGAVCITYLVWLWHHKEEAIDGLNYAKDMGVVWSVYGFDAIYPVLAHSTITIILLKNWSGKAKHLVALCSII